MSASLLHAANKRELDADFLEFLGSIDTEGEGWSEYLENAPVEKGGTDKGEKATKPPTRPPAKSAVPPSAPPKAPEKGK